MAVRRINRRCLRVRIGRVSLYLHHGAWWVYYRNGDRQIRKRVGVDRADAERVAAEVNAQVASAAPTMFAFEPVRVSEHCTRFLQHHEPVSRSAVSTINRYRAATQQFVDYVASLGCDLKVHEISANGFVNFLRLRQVSPNGHANTSKRRLRDKGVQFILEVCRSMFAFAQRQRCLPSYSTNPFAELRIDRMRIEDAKSIFVFDASTESQFLRTAGDWEFPVQFVLAKTGMRPGELCHHLIEEIDLVEKWLRIRNKPELGWSVKTRNERNVPLVRELCEVLRRVVGDRTAGLVFRRPRFARTHSECAIADVRQLVKIVKIRELAAAHAGTDLNRTQKLRLAQSVWRDAGALDPDQIRTSFIRIAKRCGLEDATCPKSWRHTFATLLQDANVDPLLRQITLGHQPSGSGGELGMTGVYTHSRPATHAREIDRALHIWPETLKLAHDWAQGGVL